MVFNSQPYPSTCSCDTSPWSQDHPNPIIALVIIHKDHVHSPSSRETYEERNTYGRTVHVQHELAALDRLTHPIIRVEILWEARANRPSLGEGSRRFLGLAGTSPAALGRFQPSTVLGAFVHEAAVGVAGPVAVGTLRRVFLTLELARDGATRLAVRFAWAVGDAVSVGRALPLGTVDFVFAA
jgi:hypothetical protein